VPRGPTGTRGAQQIGIAKPATWRRDGCGASTSCVRNIVRPHETRARDLSYGEQRQLELAITMAMKPEIVLLDEPTAGMSQSETTMILELLAELLEGLTVVIVEHDLSVVDRIAHRVVVLERGRVLCEGTPASIREDERVQSAYLKGARHA
jgi:branched-chain amino acid transport system ATP-binding protein